MRQVRATSLRVIRVPADASSDGWWCRAIDVPAAPVEVAGARPIGELWELVVAPGLTPGAPYLIGRGEGASPIALCTAPTMAQHRLDLWSLLPQHNRCADLSGDLRAFMACLQDITDLLVGRVDRIAADFDIERASSIWVARILADLGNPFQFRLSVGDARKLAGLLVQIYQQKGTARGIQNALRLFLGLDAQVECHIVTRDKGGIRLGGADRKSPFTFSLIFARPLSAQEQERARSIAEYLKPAHTFLDEILFPVSSDVTTGIEAPIKGRG